jgi:mannosylglucosylglycerate synthase
MRIGLVATRLGSVDGVSFESIKWQHVLQRMGHEVIQCAGALGAEPGGTLIPEMHLAYRAAARVTEAAFDATSDAGAIRHEVERLAASLQVQIEAWVDREELDLLIIQNAWAIPMHLPLGIALARLVAARGIPTIGHHHDYWWERDRFALCVVPELLDQAFPPDLPSVRHISINTIAAAQLRERRGLDSTVIPNVFDFEQPVPERVVERARLLRTEIRLPPDGVLFVQPTRVVPRKGIELAIELVARLAEPHGTLLITSPAGDEGTGYLVELHQMADELGVDFHYGASRFEPDNSDGPQGPAHSLAEAYIAADVITYPSLYEGFGNALVEAVFFRKLLLVNRYPVYEADIRPLGFRFLELDGAVTDEAVEAVRAALAHPDRRAADRERNFEVGRRYLSYDRLERELEALLEELG